jgi:UDPglucose--hexose-1-phosphate uridylyltransferase
MDFHVHRHVKADGRELFLYGREPVAKACLDEPSAERGGMGHLRWHPLRREWVAYSAGRQARTFLPQTQDCPLCPMSDGRGGEIPYAEFEIAVFENRFPAFAADAAMPPAMRDVEMAPAKGRCEVIVYSDDHQASLGTLTDDRLALLIEVWGERVRAMRAMGYVSVLPFENRGEEIGVTLHHPHGQIYAFDFVPRQLRRAAEAQEARPVIKSLIGSLDEKLVLRDEATALSFVPPFAMYPFEVWIAPKRRVASPDQLTGEERRSMARALGDAVRRLDALFAAPMPYILTVQAAPQGFDDTFHMVIEIRPFRRDAGKLKFLAGVEQGAGVFLVDVLPEDAAQKLRNALP